VVCGKHHRAKEASDGQQTVPGDILLSFRKNGENDAGGGTRTAKKEKEENKGGGIKKKRRCEMQGEREVGRRGAVRDGVV